jgi:anti-sigma factor RsiW
MMGRVLSFAGSPHRRTQELLPWFLNGTLDGEEADEVDRHLKECPACRAELESLRVLHAAYVETDLMPEAEAALARLRPLLQPDPPAAPQRPRPAAAAGTVPVWMRFALAAQFGVIFALGWEVAQPDRTGAEYRTLASASLPAHAAGSLVVVFDPGATQHDVMRILRQAGTRVVDGPTASGGYVLSVPDGSLNAALAALRAEPAVVLAEGLQADRSP